MPIVAELRLSAPENFLTSASRAVPGTVISRQYRAGDGEVLLSATGGDLDALDSALRADETIADSWTVADFEGRRLYGVVVELDRPFLSEVTLSEGADILENRLVDGTWHVTLELPDNDALGAVGEFCREYGITMSVDRLYVEESPESVDAFGLTPSQRETLLLAHERGYFNDPRDVTLEALAGEMDVSPTGLGRRMRRALDSLIDGALESDR